MSLSWYVDAAGRSVQIHDIEQLCALIRRREIAPETMVFDGQRQAWIPAGQTEDYHRAMTARNTAGASKGAWLAAIVVVVVVAFIVISTVAGVAMYQAKRRELKAAADQALRASDNLAATMGDKPGAKRDASALPGNFSVVPTSDMTTAIRFIAAQADKSARVTAELQTESQEIHLGSIMKPETLTSAEGIRQSRDTLAAYDRYLTKYETALTSDRKRIDSEAAQLDLSPSFRRGFIEGVHKGQEQSKQLHDQFLSVERKLVGTLNEILDFMSVRGSDATVSGGHLRFRSGSDMEAYNDLVERVRQLSRDEREIMERMAAARQDSRSHIEQLAHAAGGN